MLRFQTIDYGLPMETHYVFVTALLKIYEKNPVGVIHTETVSTWVLL